MKKYIAVIELDNDEEIIDASVSYVYRSNGTNYSTTESVEFKEEREGLNAKTYEDGLNDAWECAKKVVEMGEYDRKNVVFVRLDDGEFPFKKYSASEAITRIKEYENRIKVGDEVIDSNGMLEKRSVVVRVSGSVITIMEGDGTVSRWEKEHFKKTGRHFPQIEEVLKQLQEE